MKALPNGLQPCETCKFFIPPEVGEVGHCVFLPPVPFPIGPDQVRAFWPPVEPWRGCGQHKPRIFTAADMPDVVNGGNL